MPFPHLPRAPITEAVIDLQTELPPDVTIETLAGLQSLFADKYPVKKDRFQWQVQFNVQAQTVASEGMAQDGYLFWSANERQAVHARLNGFAFSWLKPYPDWVTFRDEARQQWAEFVRFARPLRVRRVALRFINRIELPQPVVYQDYLNTFPRTGDGVAPALSGLFMRLVAPTDGDMVVITEAIDEAGATNDSVPVILDIDVSRQAEFLVDGDDAWRALDALRDVKNRVFFGSVTTKALELFR